MRALIYRTCSSRKQSDICFIARFIPMSLLKPDSCSAKASTSHKSHLHRAKAAKSDMTCSRCRYFAICDRARMLHLRCESVSQAMCSAGLVAEVAAGSVSCDFCPAKCERMNNVTHVIAESRRLCVRRTHRAKAEETARHRPGNRSNLIGILL